MSRPAIIKQADVTRIVKGYAAAGITVGMTVKNGVPVFMPVDLIQPAAEPSPEPDAEETGDARLAMYASAIGKGFNELSAALTASIGEPG